MLGLLDWERVLRRVHRNRAERGGQFHQGWFLEMPFKTCVHTSMMCHLSWTPSQLESCMHQQMKIRLTCTHDRTDGFCRPCVITLHHHTISWKTVFSVVLKLNSAIYSDSHLCVLPRKFADTAPFRALSYKAPPDNSASKMEIDTLQGEIGNLQAAA